MSENIHNVSAKLAKIETLEKTLTLLTYSCITGAVLRRCGRRNTPQGLKIMDLLGRFEIFGCPLSRLNVDGLVQICLKHGTPVTLCALLAYIEATVAREGYYICLGCKKDVNFRCS